MGIIDRVRAVVGSGRPGPSDEATYRYECANCGTAFESNDPNTARVSCPECAGTRVRGPTSTG